MVYIHKDPTVEAGVMALVMREKRRARNRKDWEKALKNFGYALARKKTGTFVTTHPHGVEVCRLPGGYPV